MPDTDPGFRDQVLYSIKLLSRWTIVLFLCVVFVGAAGFYDSIQRRGDLQEVSVSTLQALCTFRAELQQRHDNTVQFLVDHPEGIQGIPVRQIRQTLSAQQNTLDSLSDLSCEENQP